MRHQLDERLTIAGLAHRRYPNAELPIAVMFFESDRRAAGLGALDERKRNGGPARSNAVINRKWINLLTGQVCYSRSINIKERWVLPEFEMVPPSISDAASEFVTMTKQPAKSAAIALRVDQRTLATQAGRAAVARSLRRMRRETMRP